jgi:hypothetical protein
LNPNNNNTPKNSNNPVLNSNNNNTPNNANSTIYDLPPLTGKYQPLKPLNVLKPQNAGKSNTKRPIKKNK